MRQFILTRIRFILHRSGMPQHQKDLTIHNSCRMWNIKLSFQILAVVRSRLEVNLPCKD